MCCSHLHLENDSNRLIAILFLTSEKNVHVTNRTKQRIPRPQNKTLKSEEVDHHSRHTPQKTLEQIIRGGRGKEKTKRDSADNTVTPASGAGQA